MLQGTLSLLLSPLLEFWGNMRSEKSGRTVHYMFRYLANNTANLFANQYKILNSFLGLEYMQSRYLGSP